MSKLYAILYTNFVKHWLTKASLYQVIFSYFHIVQYFQAGHSPLHCYVLTWCMKSLVWEADLQVQVCSRTEPMFTSELSQAAPLQVNEPYVDCGAGCQHRDTTAVGQILHFYNLPLLIYFFADRPLLSSLLFPHSRTLFMIQLIVALAKCSGKMKLVHR